MSEQVTFTQAAIDQVQAMFNENILEDEIEAIRVFIAGGGCSGFQYGFTPETSIGDDDTVFDFGRVKFLIDPLSMAYLEGSTVDFKKDVMAQQFTISNPNVTSQCGCGNSFSA